MAGGFVACQSLFTSSRKGRQLSRVNTVLTDPPSVSQVWDFDIAIVGLGYVGLPTALAFRAAGSRVLGVDVDESRLASVRTGSVDLVPGDQLRLGTANAEPEGWWLTSDVASISRARAVIVCVPTPIDAHAVPDLHALTSACSAVLDAAVPGQLLILTSTSYVGCTRDLLVHPLIARGLQPGVDVHVAFSPERINPADEAFGHEEVPRVVGGFTASCTELAAATLGQYVDSPHLVETLEIAEASKLLENSFRAVNIAFINEFASVCRELGVPVTEVIDAAATKPYGFMPFRPGPGVGGHCIPCDPHYLLWQLRADRVSSPILEEAMNALAHRPQRVAARVGSMLAAAGVVASRARVVVLGVAYKPNVADVRESTATEIIQLLSKQGMHVSFIDSHVPSIRLADGQLLAASSQEELLDADLVLLHTRHEDTDLAWLGEHQCVLDATYTLPARTGQALI
ncbi:nucleotide sugar dehydrogenase [Pseudoclavibacter sp. VKM Ac-2888]|nr:nucleotide sugar dehydrogenase [Pseudoclavibacter sp. VKM Ac-2888]PPF78180.1 nucleotide sugar dehydrogenase [Pseudoclavibacter sp. Z016]PPG00989.1 nucleotide sugar dehydrogenase [Pseudoclavibacter sp. RFBI5]